jgi:hypothetical protein
MEDNYLGRWDVDDSMHRCPSIRNTMEMGRSDPCIFQET